MANTFLATYDFDAAPVVADVRFVIQDVDVVSSPPEDNPDDRTQWSCIFTDQEIQRRVSLHPDDTVNQAAADLLMFMASSNAILARLITLGEYTSDTRSTADKLRAQAMALRTMTADTNSAGMNDPAEYIHDEAWTDFDVRREFYGLPPG
jgi:hypothetical protein